MEQHEIRLVEEDNTIYEIDMDCVKRKQLAAKRAMEAEEKENWIWKTVKQKKCKQIKSRGSSPRLF
ncbi:MAG: hypothetical protein ACLRMZ_08505 [Blautia marasmi]